MMMMMMMMLMMMMIDDDDDDDDGDDDDDDDDDLFRPEPFTKATTHAFIYMMYIGSLLQPLPGGTPRLLL